MSDTTKKYLDLPGLQEYDKGVKNALTKKVNENDLLNKKVGSAVSADKAAADANGNDITETYATKDELANLKMSKNYNDLTNKPKIDGVELAGDKTHRDIGIVPLDEIEILALLSDD